MSQYKGLGDVLYWFIYLDFTFFGYLPIIKHQPDMSIGIQILESVCERFTIECVAMWKVWWCDIPTGFFCRKWRCNHSLLCFQFLWSKYVISRNKQSERQIYTLFSSHHPPKRTCHTIQLTAKVTKERCSRTYQYSLCRNA